MHRLTVLFDADCGLCARVKGWLERQPSYVPLEFIAAGTEEACRRFPQLDPASTRASLTVVADDSDVYRGDRAFVICLWALRSTRAWSLKLGARGEGALARRFFELVSRHRRSAPAGAGHPEGG